MLLPLIRIVGERRQMRYSPSPGLRDNRSRLECSGESGSFSGSHSIFEWGYRERSTVASFHLWWEIGIYQQAYAMDE